MGRKIPLRGSTTVLTVFRKERGFSHHHIALGPHTTAPGLPGAGGVTLDLAKIHRADGVSFLSLCLSGLPVVEIWTPGRKVPPIGRTQELS